jgi:hypothetical protein
LTGPTGTSGVTGPTGAGGVGTVDRFLVFSDDTEMSETSQTWTTKKSFRIVRDSDKAPTKWRFVVSLRADIDTEVAECQAEILGSDVIENSSIMSTSATVETVCSTTLTIDVDNEPVDTLPIIINIQLRKGNDTGTEVFLRYTDVFALF